MKRFQGLMLGCAIALSAAPAAAQDTTGRMLVRTSHSDGSLLPGVTVSISSPALIGGTQTAITDAMGEALFLTLAPGHYEVLAGLPGFATQERHEVRVRLGAVTALMVELPEARFEGEITVLDETPVVDPMQVGTEQVFDAEYISRTTIGSWGRFVSSPGHQTPGITNGQDIFGSIRSENAWFLDGIDITYEPLGDQGTGGVAMSGIDAYQEIEVKTGGYEAEYGRAMGGVVSVVTKSGGNLFSGSLDVRYQADAFQESGEHFDPDEQESSSLGIDATLGGPILRDRLWFFLAYYHGEASDTPADSPISQKPKVTAPKAKLTWQASSSWRGTASYFGSAVTFENANASRWTMPEAAGMFDRSTDYLSLGFDGMLSDALLWNTRVGYNRNTFEARPMTGDREAIAHINYVTGIQSGNFYFQDDEDSDRLQAATDLTWFLSGAGGVHELKAGLEFSKMESTIAWCYTGTAGGVGCNAEDNGHVFGDIQIAGQDIPYQMRERAGEGPLDTSGFLWVAYLQDAWRPTPNLTVKAGLRYDAIDYDMHRTGSAVSMDRWQPRLGMAWDLSGDARNVLRASVGRFMDPATMNLPWYGVNHATFSYWTSCSLFGMQMGLDPAMCPAIANANGFSWRSDPEGWDPHGWFLDPSKDIVGEGDNVVDPGLESAYSDQLTLSYERALWPRSSVELSLVVKRTHSLFEDTCDGNVPEPTEGAVCDHYVMANFPQLEREYDAFIVRFETRTLDWLTLLGSYTLSDSEGNQESIGFGWDWDRYPWHWENRTGYLDNHYRHHLKLNGFVLLPYDFTIAFDAGWRSGFRWTPQMDEADIEEMPDGTYFVEPRGSREGDAAPWFDLQLSKGFRIGPTHLDLIVSVLNVFSKEQATEVCEMVRGCGGDFELGDPTRWEAPRRWEVGFRLTF